MVIALKTGKNRIRVKSKSGELHEFDVHVTVNSKGLFIAELPHTLYGVAKGLLREFWDTINLHNSRNTNKFRAEALADMSRFVSRVYEVAQEECEEIVEDVIVFTKVAVFNCAYNAETDTYLPTPGMHEGYMYVMEHANDRYAGLNGSHLYHVGLGACAMRKTTVLGKKTAQSRYVKDDSSADKITLNSFRGLSLPSHKCTLTSDTPGVIPRHAREIPYTPEAAKFFIDELTKFVRMCHEHDRLYKDGESVLAHINKLTAG